MSVAASRVVTLVDLDIQNILSVENAFRTVGAEVRVVRHAADIVEADLLVLPGVGSFGAASARLHGSGVAEAIRHHVRERGKPLLGLCLGMQLLADSSEEHGMHAGLGLIPGKVERLQEAPPEFRVPNVGWREVMLNQPVDEMLSAHVHGRSFYHVHSFHLRTDSTADTLATSRFGPVHIASIVRRGQVMGTQFHPEKSQEAGLDLLHAVLRRLR